LTSCCIFNCLCVLGPQGKYLAATTKNILQYRPTLPLSKESIKLQHIASNHASKLY